MLKQAAKKPDPTTDGLRRSLPGVPVVAPAQPVVIGRIARPVGLSGEVKVICESVAADRMTALASVKVLVSGECRRLDIDSCHQSDGVYRIKFRDVEDVETASLLKGCEVVVDLSERIEAPDDSYFVDDLVGCRVVADDGTELGWLHEVIHQGHHDLWVVQGPLGEILLPAVSEFILAVHPEEHLITVRRVEGLWDER